MLTSNAAPSGVALAVLTQDRYFIVVMVIVVIDILYLNMGHCPKSKDLQCAHARAHTNYFFSSKHGAIFYSYA